MVNNFFLFEASLALSSNFTITLNLRFFNHLCWEWRSLNSFRPYWLSFTSCWFTCWTVLWLGNLELSTWSRILISCNKKNICWNSANVNFLLRKILLGNLNEAVSLTKISTIGIASFRFPGKFLLKRDHKSHSVLK